MYTVLKPFVDGENGAAWPPHMGGFYYAKGDSYPKKGFTPSSSHIDYLLGSENSFKSPVIEEQTQLGTINQPTLEELMKMNKKELVEYAETSGVRIETDATKEIIAKAILEG